MKRLALFLLAASFALPARAAKDKFKVIHVADLAAALKSDMKPTVCDANNEDTREKAGVIPGAILLPHYKNFEKSGS